VNGPWGKVDVTDPFIVAADNTPVGIRLKQKAITSAKESAANRLVGFKIDSFKTTSPPQN